MGAVLQELQDAGAVFEGGETASAWAYGWAKEAGAATAAVGPSTPRRKLEEAKELDAALSG